jgi:hypothetical protein
MGEPTSNPLTCEDQFIISVMCVSGPCAKQVYEHTYDVTWVGFEFTGTGQTSEGGTIYEETICGAVTGGTLTYHVVYTTVVPGYTIDGSGAIAGDGTATGTAIGNDPRGATQDVSFITSPLNVACE